MRYVKLLGRAQKNNSRYLFKMNKYREHIYLFNYFILRII
ncbi:hypothetical protein THALO_420028 [Tenacibaculum halocynthiae]